MEFLSKRWYDLGGLLAVIVLGYVAICYEDMTNYQLIMWSSLVTLFFHQLEEYRIVGNFPGMVNAVMYNSKMPDRFPLNPKTSFCINVLVGWGTYFASALVAERVVWLGMASILISIGNVVAHTLLFNIKGRTLYNAGLATSWLLFVPVVYLFFDTIIVQRLATTTDYIIGISLGIVLNYIGILKLIDWMADEATTSIFPSRNLLRIQRDDHLLRSCSKK